MTKPSLNTNQQLVSCEICLKSIPVSEAKSAEAEDYVAYFCGLECYDQWKHQESQHASGVARKPKEAK
ncbi:MAG: hypothetical protein QG652_1434 [Pseudomonadota bacterium]|nr:hypothetical protein [Pseudomonadota bacterium]